MGRINKSPWYQIYLMWIRGIVAFEHNKSRPTANVKDCHFHELLTPHSPFSFHGLLKLIQHEKENQTLSIFFVQFQSNETCKSRTTKVL